MTTQDDTTTRCPRCEKHFLRISVHLPHCKGLRAADEQLVERSTAHIVPSGTLKRSQAFTGGVRELDVARLMLAVEQGNAIKLGRFRWVAPAGHRGGAMFSRAVSEAIRTGLLRDYRDPATGEHHLIPALVHLRDFDGASVCKFAGEDMGPVRARLVDDIALTDCRNCEATVSTGNIRQV